MDKPTLRARAQTVPRAVLFDAYGTLFDVYSVSLLAEQLFPGHGERLSILWRDKQIDYTRLCSMSGAAGEHYRPFWELTRAGLRYAALRLGLVLGIEAEERLMNQYHHLSSFP
jgi:2-haloacid dehalogenase